ncbi:microfibril-associated glycoprotein 4-like [Saccostrea cucullata]|uniref:microfibril-associated glycoprotein 4-like n=1 Tax=Saccostrea cuccullata TaxID=36930 RepID=UPI002ED40735
MLSTKNWSQNISKGIDGSTTLISSYRFPVLQNTNSKGKLIQSGLVPVDCSDIRKALPSAPSGVYKIYPAGGHGHTAYCDMTMDGGGWTVFQRRMDGSVNFFRWWKEYKNGFGHLKGEHWLGNQILYEITNLGWYELRINLEDFDGKKRFAKYSHFKIGHEAQGYKLMISGYTGNAGDSMALSQGLKFTTYDRDQDSLKKVNCAVLFSGGWWFKDCLVSHLNGFYYRNPVIATKAHGVVWYHWKGYKYSLKSTTMMLRKHSSKKSK